MISRPSTRTGIAWFAVLGLILTLAIGTVGCGEDSKDNGGGAVATASERLNDGVRGLADFGTRAVGEVIAISPEILDLIGQLIPEFLGDTGFLIEDLAAGRITPGILRATQMLAPTAGLSKMGISDHFGTYDRDSEDVEGHFLGWVLVEAGVPSDGLVFRFDGEDGIRVLQGEELVLAEGEIRMVDVVLEEVTLPDESVGTLPTSFVFEVDAGPAGLNATEVLLRVTFGLTHDAETQSFSISIGDENASSHGDSGASFIGGLFFALSLGIEDTDVDLVAQLYDSEGQFAIRFAATLAGVDLGAEVVEPTSVNLQFAFGTTTNPANPPFLIDITVDEFVEVEGNQVGEVSGSITNNGTVLATLSGDTSSVPVLINEEETECPNVIVTFADAPGAPQNICVALEDLFDLLSLGGAMAKLAGANL